MFHGEMTWYFRLHDGAVLAVVDDLKPADVSSDVVVLTLVYNTNRQHREASFAGSVLLTDDAGEIVMYVTTLAPSYWSK